MERVALHFFPYPHVFKGERLEGAILKWPKRCFNCDRQCEASEKRGLQLCSYGVNYYRFDKDLLVAGVVVHDYPEQTAARKKMLKIAGKEAISSAEIEQVHELAMKSVEAFEAELRAKKDEIIARYKGSREYQAEIVEQLRPDIEAALAQVHDYKQFVQQIVQNMNVILQTRFPGMGLEEQLEQASHEEAAIYWAARLMEEKLDAALFIRYPDRINEVRERRRFRFHGMVTKYRKIYQRRLEEKRLRLSLGGESRGEVEGNPRAIAIIPHALIDNAIKYAPPETEVVIDVREDQEAIELTVGSFGPLVYPDERTRIFDLFYRGRAAESRDREGTGFGLASAQAVAKATGAQIRMTQTDRSGAEDTCWTEFSFRMELAPPRERSTGDRRAWGRAAG